MIKILIISIPEGGAPEEIRKQWVDLEIPLSDEPFHRQTTDKETFFSVEGKDAIQALLDAGKIDAANFWGAYKTGQLSFPINSCKKIG